MAKVKIKDVAEHITLYRDSATGIAFVENGRTGNGHSAHPNIDSTGSVTGMKKLGFWRQEDRTKRCGGAIYNIDKLAVSDELDELARQHCQCGGKHA